jgi:hypothetical protein
MMEERKTQHLVLWCTEKQHQTFGLMAARRGQTKAALLRDAINLALADDKFRNEFLAAKKAVYARHA